MALHRFLYFILKIFKIPLSSPNFVKYVLIFVHSSISLNLYPQWLYGVLTWYRCVFLHIKKKRKKKMCIFMHRFELRLHVVSPTLTCKVDLGYKNEYWKFQLLDNAL